MIARSVIVAGSIVLVDPGRREKRLAELRERRMLLRGLRDDVDLTWRGLLREDLGGCWRSAAQRGYLDRRRELADELRRADRDLDEVLTAVNAAITAITASG